MFSTHPIQFNMADSLIKHPVISQQSGHKLRLLPAIVFCTVFFLSFCGGPDRVIAQDLIDLGTYPGDLYSGAIAINNNDIILGASSNAASLHLAYWINGQIQIIDTPYLCRGYDINEQGTMCGFAMDTTGSAWYLDRAAKWDNGVMTLIPPDPPPAAISTYGYSINDSGWVVGDRFDNTGSGSMVPFIDQNGLFRDLPLFPSGTHGRARAINNQGVVAGYATTGVSELSYVGCVWFNDKIYKLPTTFPHGWAFDVNDSNMVVGVVDYGDNTWGHLALWKVTILDNFDLLISDPIIPSMEDKWSIKIGGFYSTKFWIKINNKNVVIASTTYGGVSYLYNNGQFAWLDSMGIDMSPLHGLHAAGINDSGHIVGVGTTGEYSHGFLLNARYLSISKPEENDLLVAGEVNDIRWGVSGVDAVDIYYKTEKEDIYHPIAFGLRASTGVCSWRIPDDLLARKVIIRIEDANSTTYTVSKTFRIKGYQLTRVTSEGEYEPYRPDVHGWNIPNIEEEMWPEDWYTQFDYRYRVDARTKRLYPGSWTKPPIEARSWDFPDWELLSGIYGTHQCYYTTSLTGRVDYVPSAVQFWREIHMEWNGSCYGSGMASFLAFDRKEVFLSRFGLPDFTNLYDVARTDANRLVINQLWTVQYSAANRAYDAAIDVTPVETLEDIRTMFMTESTDNRPLIIIDLGENGGGHILNPYKILKDVGDQTIEQIYVYDSSHPGDTTVYIEVDKDANTWQYKPLGWSGSRPGYFFLTRPASTSLEIPTIFATAPARRSMAKSSLNSGRIEIYTSPAGNVMIYGPGGIIEYNQSTGINLNLTGARPIIPLTGSSHQPIGYTVPDAEYYGMNAFWCRDSLAYMAVNLDSVIYFYARSQADSNQGTSLSYVNEEPYAGCTFSASNVDSAVATYQATIRSDSSEKVFMISCPQTGANHSYSIGIRSGSTLRFANPSYAQMCRMELTEVSSRGAFTLEYDSLYLDENTAVTIRPDWDSLLVQPVKIYIDHGQDGTFEDSTIISGEATGFGKNTKIRVPSDFALDQNYPNPLNPRTTIRYQIPVRSMVTLRVYDLLGREMATLVDGFQEAGYKSVTWDGTGMPSGMYFYRLTAGDFTGTRKLLLIK